MATSLRAVMKKSQTKPSCLQCSIKGVACQSGTLSGSCINCGGGGPQFITQRLGNFFNDALIHFLSRIAAALCIALGSADSYYNILEIQLTTMTGLTESHTFEIHGTYDASNTKLEYPLDQMVWMSYTSNIREKDTKTDLVTKAIFIRGYLALLFATNVTERLKFIQDGAYTYERIPGSDLGLHLTNFILFRLNRLISDVMNAILLKGHSSDGAYLQDVSAAAAVLYTGLMDTCDGLTTGRLKPLCGGPELADLLLQQIQSTARHLEQHLGCDPNWSAHLKGPLESLRSITIIINMDLTLERRLYDPIPTSPSISPSTIFDMGNTPASSTDQQSLPDTGVDDTISPVTPDGLSITGPMPFHVPEAYLFVPASGASGKMASQVSDPFGFTLWNHWPEQNNDTWRQS